MNCKQIFLELLKKYDGDLSKTTEEHKAIIFKCKDQSRVINIKQYDMMREARDEYKISKTNSRDEKTNHALKV